MSVFEHHLGHAPGQGNGRIVGRAIALTLLSTQLLTSCVTVPLTLPAPVPDRERVLNIGDIVRIEVWRQPEFSGEFQIGTDSAMVHPLYQDVKLAGLPASTARDELANYLTNYVQAARLVVEPLYSVSVAGEVRQPGMFHVSRGTTVAEAVALAGGPTVLARLDEMRLVRDTLEYRLGLNDALTSYGAVPVVSGDQILVDRQSRFSVWRDIVGPVATLAALLLTVIRLRDNVSTPN